MQRRTRLANSFMVVFFNLPSPLRSQELVTATWARTTRRRDGKMSGPRPPRAPAAQQTAAPVKTPSRPPPPVRSLPERALDYAMLSGAGGGFVGACMVTRHHISAWKGAAGLGGASALLGASFIGLRHALLQGDFSQDREAVSGLAAGGLAMVVRTIIAGPQSGGLAGALFFTAGCAGHHAHRYWLNYRLSHGWDLGADPKLLE